MSATVELLPPLLSYNFGGTIFRQGVAQHVDYDTARRLAENSIFKVHGLDTKDVAEAAARAARPPGEELDEAIREAADALDIEDPANFDRNDKPDHRAISEVLGYPINAFERDRALGYNKSGRAAQGKLDAAVEKIAAPVSRASITIKRAAAAKTAAETKPTEPAKTEPPVDQTTQGAITF